MKDDPFWGPGYGGLLPEGWKSGRKTSSCYHSHPGLKLGDTGWTIWGGSCSAPVVTDADVYVGFDSSMRFTHRQWPWSEGHEILFEIRDMGAPSKPREFVRLVDWTIEQLGIGRKVHAGCVGGHGRTGMFLSAVVAVACKEPDAISYVREHYCTRAVESADQIAFLVKHFGVKQAAAGKSYASGIGWGKLISSSAKSSRGRITPLPNADSIWGKSLLL